jgi:hypothetical protein
LDDELSELSGSLSSSSSSSCKTVDRIVGADAELVGASVAGANETVAADATGADAAGADAAGAVCTVEIGTGTVGSTGIDTADAIGVGTADTAGFVVADGIGVGAVVGFEFCESTINGDIGGNATINGDGVVKLIGLALSRAFRTAWNDDDRCKIRSS